MAITLRCTPTCGAASPTPLASYIVSAVSSQSLRILASTSPTGLAFCFRRGSGQMMISRNAMLSRSPAVQPGGNRPVYSWRGLTARMGFRSAASDSVTDGASEQRHRVHVDRQLHTRHPLGGLQGAPDAVEGRVGLSADQKLLAVLTP